MPSLTADDLKASFQRALIIASALAIVGIAAFRYGPGVYATLSGQELGGGIANSGRLIRQPFANGNGLVGWWRLDGDAKDSGPNGYNGTLVNAPTISGGKFGAAYTFDGASNYISIPGGGGLNGASAGTISMWVMWNGTQTSNVFSQYGTFLVRQSDGVFSDNFFFNEWG